MTGTTPTYRFTHKVTGATFLATWDPATFHLRFKVEHPPIGGGLEDILHSWLAKNDMMGGLRVYQRNEVLPTISVRFAVYVEDIAIENN